jgi:predicted PurR-regulated permease PerM
VDRASCRQAPGDGATRSAERSPSTSSPSSSVSREQAVSGGRDEREPGASPASHPVPQPASGERRTAEVAQRPASPAGPVDAEHPAPAARESGSIFTVDRVVRFLLGVAAVGAAAWGIWYFAGLVVYLVVGGIFAYLLRPVVDRLQGFGLGRVPAILVTFVLLFAVASVLVTSIVPFVATQIRDISQLVSVEAATDVADYVETRVREVVPIEEGVLVENIQQLANALVSADLVEGDKVAQTVTSVVSVFTNILYAVIIIPFITFFLLKDGVQIRRSLLQMVPNKYFEVSLAILAKVEANIGRYFRALLVQSTSIAIIASTLLWLVGLDNPIAIGLFTGLANTIPYFGPFLGFLGGSLVGIAQTGTFSLVPGVALAMGLTQLADNVLLQPLIFSRAAQAHPLIILFVVLIGAQLGGIVGMLVAIPLATTVRVVAEQVIWSIRNYRILRLN